MNLFLDDIRFPENVTHVKIPKVKWHIVRNYDDFKYFIDNFGIPSVISLDHDLGIKSMEEFSKNGLNYSYDRIGNEKTGLHCLEYLLNEIEGKRLKPIDQIYIHTINPIGKQNMINLLRNKKYLF